MKDIIERNIRLYTSQFCDSTNLQAFTRALMRDVESLCNDFQSLLNDRWIDNAIGIQLDRMGELVGVARRNRDDNTYRRALQFQTYINISSGTPETMISVIRELTDALKVSYRENYPTGIEMFTDGLNVLNAGGVQITDSIFTLDDGCPLVLDGGEELMLRSASDTPTSILDFLNGVRPVGVDLISIAFSLGQMPLFGFEDDVCVSFLNAGDGYLLKLYDGSLFNTVIVPRISDDDCQGFADLEYAPFALDDGCPLITRVENLVPINIPLALNGVPDNSQVPLILQTTGRISDLADNNSQPIMSDNGYPLRLFTETLVDQDVGLDTDDGGALVTDDGCPLNITFRTEEIFEDKLILEDKVEYGTPIYGAKDGEGILALDDEGELELNVLDSRDELKELSVLDDEVGEENAGGKYTDVIVG